MKQYVAGLLAAAGMLSALIGCGLGGSGQDGHGAGRTNMQATVGTWKTAQTITPYFYQDFLEEGASVTVLPFTNPGDQKTALLAGSLNMTGTTLPTAIAAAAAGEPLKIVASLCNKCSALVVGKNTNIEGPSDLKGKTIGYVPGTMHHVLLLDTLRRAGLNSEDVTLIRIDFFDMGQALAEGKIDAFLSGEPYPSQAVKNGYGRILSYPYFDDSIGTINAAMMVTDQTIEQNAELVQKLVDAHIAATQYKNRAVDAWLDKAASFGTDRAMLEASMDNMELCWDIDGQYIQNCNNLAEQMLELGMIQSVPDVEQMFDLSFLEQAKNRGIATDCETDAV